MTACEDTAVIILTDASHLLFICISAASEYNSIELVDDQNPLVIYNRVPKTGSTSFVNVAYDLHSRNAFRVLHVNVTGNSHLLSVYDQVLHLPFPMPFVDVDKAGQFTIFNT